MTVKYKKGYQKDVFNPQEGAVSQLNMDVRLWRKRRKKYFWISVLSLCIIWFMVNLRGNRRPSQERSGYHETTKRFGPKINCSGIIQGHEPSMQQGKIAMEKYQSHVFAISDERYLELTQNCEKFKSERGYIVGGVDMEEEQFPVAFSILLYKEAEQAERLLRTIYRPQNVFCLHVDGYSPAILHAAVKAIADCFPNVFVVSKTEHIVYKGYSRLMADINCMRDLVGRAEDWKYFINLPSQAFPLNTNKELVAILKAYNGANDIEGITGGGTMSYRYTYKFKLVTPHGAIKPEMQRTDRRKEPAPHGLHIVKGSAYGVFSRAFVDFVLQNPIAQDFLEWCHDIETPDEYFWSTLHHLHSNGHLETPGGYKGPPDDKPFLSMFVSWTGEAVCQGMRVREVCVFGIEDLQNLVTRKELFVNKFHLDYQPLALSCMEEWILNKTLNNMSVDISYYQSLPFAKQMND